MNKNISYIIVGLLLSTALYSSCGKQKSKDGRTDTYSSGVISFTSDESFSPIIEEERELFESIYVDATLKPIYTNESDGIDSLLNLKTNLVIAGRDFKPAEKKNLEDRKFMPRSFAIAYDGWALIVNKENPDTCISINDIVKILTGKATKWSDIYPNSKQGDIVLVFDNKKSSTVHFAEDSILKGRPITAPNASAAINTADVVNYVEKNKDAIGIIGSNWLNDKRDTTNLTFNKNIRVMAVSRLAKATPANSWKPYQAYIYNGNYPLVRTIYCLINDPINGLPWGFAQFIRSPKGQMVIFKSGLLPVQGDITIRDVNISTN